MEEQNIIKISVIWRGNQLNLEIDPKCNIKEFGNILLDFTNVKPDTLKLLVPINKSSKLITPFSDSHSSLSLQDIGIIDGKEIRMLGVFENEIEEVSENDKRHDLRIIGFEDEEKRHKNRSFANRPQTSLKLPKGPYTFCDFRTLTLPGIQLNPPSSEALKRMHMLACDPGIIAIMNKYKWRVGIMTEMAPVGYVGISPKCILGFNKNKGEEISLRLRTDDLKGFRKYESIKKTLLHELAHMVHSEHDADFFALDKQLNEEAVRLNWTKSTGHTLNGHKSISSYEEEFLFESNNNNNNNKISNKLGGEINAFVSPRASSINAAYKRLINSFNEKYEPDPDESKPDSDNLNDILSINEPDPDDNNKPDIDNNLNDILSINEPDPDDNKPDIDNNLNDILSINEPDPDDNNKPDFDNNLNDILSINEPDPDDNKPDIDNNLNNGITINEPDQDENNKLDFDNLNNILGMNENTKEIIMAEPDSDDSVTLETRINNELDLVHEHQNIKSNSDEDFIIKSDPDIMLIEEPGVVFCSKVQNIIQILKSELTSQEASSVLQTLSKIIRNVIEHPNDAKFKKLRKANPHLQRNVANYTGAMEVLKMVGFNEEIIGDETYLVLKRNDPGLLWLAKSSLELNY